MANLFKHAFFAVRVISVSLLYVGALQEYRIESKVRVLDLKPALLERAVASFEKINFLAAEDEAYTSLIQDAPKIMAVDPPRYKTPNREDHKGVRHKVPALG